MSHLADNETTGVMTETEFLAFLSDEWRPSPKWIHERCLCRWTNYSRRYGWFREYANTRCPIHGTNPSREPPPPEGNTPSCAT